MQIKKDFPSNTILSDTDNNSRGEITAVIATLFDWKEAFPRQCPKLGIEAFIKCGDRPALIPVLINYLQGRTMKVKWNGEISSERTLNGGGPQGSTFGIWEYLAQSNNNADCVDPNYRYKFVDDLTVLEKVNLLAIGLSSFYHHATVSSIIPTHNQFIPAEHLQTQKFIDTITDWTEKRKMILNQKKTKVMIFNFTDNYKFTAKCMLKNEIVEVVNQSKLLGVIMSDDLKWDKNTEYIVSKANTRMQLLRKISEFTTSKEEKKNIYILFVRSILEQSCVVWHSSLTQENSDDLERVQKGAVRIILGGNYEDYEEALIKIDLDTLKIRREELCKTFAKKCVNTNNEKIKNMFPVRNEQKYKNIRKREQYLVNFANTKRYQISSIPYMQRLLNKDQKLE